MDDSASILLSTNGTIQYEHKSQSPPTSYGQPEHPDAAESPNPPVQRHAPQATVCLLNAQCITPCATSANKWKIPYISETILNSGTGNTVPFLAITETWLKNYITDAQIAVPNYSPVRADRDKRRGGGALLYVHSSLTYENVSTYSDGSCEAVICILGSINTVIACI